MTEGRRLRSGCEGRQGAAPGLGCGFLEAPLRAHTNITASWAMFTPGSYSSGPFRKEKTRVGVACRYVSHSSWPRESDGSRCSHHHREASLLRL